MHGRTEHPRKFSFYSHCGQHYSELSLLPGNMSMNEASSQLKKIKIRKLDYHHEIILKVRKETSK